MLEIEITEVNLIEGGIEVFARAFNESGQIGFGEDGTVDIERFRIINPPVLVDDLLGDIIEPYTIDVTGERGENRFREDAEEAIMQSLEQTINLVGKEGSNIIAGKVGNTTTTVYATVDARLRVEDSTSRTWSDARDEVTANDLEQNASTSAGPYIEISVTVPNLMRLVRYFANFSTTAIGTDTIDSAIFSVYVNAVPWDTLNDANSYVSVIQNGSASDTSFVVADFDAIYNADNTTPLVGTKKMKELCDAGQRRDLSTATLGFNNYTLNATGEGIINGSGYTKLGLAIGNDIEDIDPSTGSYEILGLQYRGVGYTGTASDPKLVVQHSAAVSTSIKEINGLAIASVKSRNGLAIASVKSINGLSNVS